MRLIGKVAVKSKEYNGSNILPTSTENGEYDVSDICYSSDDKDGRKCNVYKYVCVVII